MANKDHETWEDYLQLEQYIEEIEAGRPTQPPADLTPEQRRIYRMTAFLCFPFARAVSPALPFVEALRVRLLAMVEEVTDTQPQFAHRAAVSRRTRPRRTRGVHHHRRSPCS
jgi:hypothetical protein